MKNSTKKWFVFDLDCKGNQSPNKAGPQLTKEPPSVRQSTPLAPERQSFSFHSALEPKTAADLAVHPKKIKEVDFWLDHNVLNRQRSRQTTAFLLVTGPTGSGKTATVKTLCGSKNLTVSEWSNPMDQDYSITRGPNQMGRFGEFLTESKWGSLVSPGDNKVVLVEEFPNVVIRSPEEFWTVLEECYYKGSYAVVFICTDSFDNGTSLSQKLFPQQVQDKYAIHHISFNSCASTLLKGALKRAHNLVQENLDLFKTPSVDTVDAIVATSMGDIRCAVNQYYFASLLGSTDLPTVVGKVAGKPSGGSKRKRGSAPVTVKVMSRDENLGLFHSLGRVLNPKRTGTDGRLVCDVERLVDEFSTQPGIFTDFLFENYVKYFGDLHDACRAAEILSSSRTLLEKWTDGHDAHVFALWLSVLGLMVCNEHKVSRWNQIRGPTRINRKVDSSGDLEMRNFPATDLFYYNIITKNDKLGGYV